MQGKTKVILSGIIFYMDVEGQELLEHFLNIHQPSNRSAMNGIEARVKMENEAATYFLEALNLGKSHISLTDVKVFTAKYDNPIGDRKRDIQPKAHNLVTLLSIISIF